MAEASVTTLCVYRCKLRRLFERGCREGENPSALACLPLLRVQTHRLFRGLCRSGSYAWSNSTVSRKSDFSEFLVAGGEVLWARSFPATLWRGANVVRVGQKCLRKLKASRPPNARAGYEIYLHGGNRLPSSFAIRLRRDPNFQRIFKEAPLVTSSLRQPPANFGYGCNGGVSK